jgi:hypothetical protein
MKTIRNRHAFPGFAFFALQCGGLTDRFMPPPGSGGENSDCQWFSALRAAYNPNGWSNHQHKTFCIFSAEPSRWAHDETAGTRFL